MAPVSQEPTAETIARWLAVARGIVDAVTYCVAATPDGQGGVSARIVQPRPLGDDWTVDTLTNRRCRKVREVEAAGRLTLLYQHDESRGYASLSGPAEVVDDRALKRASWTPAHDRWNVGGPDNPDTLYLRMRVERIELWSAGEGVMPEPEGYSAAVLVRDGDGWRVGAT